MYASLHHADCEVLVAPTKGRCLSCIKHRNSLRAIISRATSDDRTNPSSHTNYTVLTTQEKHLRLKRLHKEMKLSREKLKRLREKISQDAERVSADVDNDLDEDLRSIIASNDETITQSHPEGTFQRIFWEQQKKASSLNDARSMKWHPLFIKWCLYLRHVAGKGYEMLRNSKCIRLPSQRTLRDYTHHTSANIGFSHEVDEQLRSAVDMSEERNRYVNMKTCTLYLITKFITKQHV